MTYDVVIGVGQSNVAGAATDFVSGDQYPAGIYMWNHATSTIVPATEPQSNADTITGMGVTNTFLKDYAENYLPSGRDLLIVNVSRGGTGFSTPSTNSSGTGLHWRYDIADDSNNLARRGLEKIEAAMAAAGAGARIVAFLANHGSTDGSNNIGKTLMKTYLTAWINWIRGELDIPTVPYIAMQMRRNLIDDEPRHKAIDDATQEVAAELDYVVHVPSPLGDAYYKSTDVVHFNALGVRTIGHSMYDAWEPLSAQFGGTWSDTWSDTWGGASAPDDATGTGALEFTFEIGGVGASEHTGGGGLSYAFAVGGLGETDKSGAGSLTYDFRISAQAANGQDGTGHLTYTFTIAGEGSAPAVDDASGVGALGFTFAIGGSGKRDARGTGGLAAAWALNGAGRTDRAGAGSLAWTYTITGSSQSKPFPTIRTLLGTAPTRALTGTAPTRTLEGNRS